ncbi:SpoIIE family protein phosphatase [Kitasatospora sp. NBC_00240]|uniref:SpoIIE family protein phosphatase n=1 Tax=Kitasatospora sp. NBC_00240 TaxID=2903567 RepID=UPI00224F37D4|nr:SpoIIE family protein phosphatase [Kitasatospora sp. NBC_00240]MCX5208809.1 SpoIIE family protein phosphatase [Kitasatospora sp. NBC_00240]
MTADDASGSGPRPARVSPSPPGGLLDVLGVAAVVLDAQGRIALWSPQAEELFGWSAEEALGRFAARLMVAEENVDLVIELFARVLSGGDSWAGVFPIRHKDGGSRAVEFRNMRLLDEHGDRFALGIAADQAVLGNVERNLALSTRLVSQSPIGFAVVDTDLRYVLVNPALERINGLPAAQVIGLGVRDALPFLDAEAIESAMRRVLVTGEPMLNVNTVGRTPADPGTDHAWSGSFYRLEDGAGRVIGVAVTVVDVTDRFRAADEAARARRRLAVIADASVRIGTTLGLERTARELADLVVPELADIAAVDVLDAALGGRPSTEAPTGPATFRALAVTADRPSEALRAADPVGEPARYEADRLVTRCVTTGRPILVPRVGPRDLSRIARDPDAAAQLADASLHSYLAVPLIARGEVLGALDLKRTTNPLPFDEDDLALAVELAGRAAVSIDNARWYQSERGAALALQRHLLPQDPPRLTGLEIAYRYQPAQATQEVGGDWFDAIPGEGDTSVLVIGDVMGSGINAAAAMGQLRTAARTLADLDLDPSQVIRHLDRITAGLGEAMATCVYAVHDLRRARCRLCNAGHLPPVLVPRHGRPRLIDLPTGAPLGVGGVEFEARDVDLDAGDLLVLYTDGLVETRDQSIDARLDLLLSLLDGPRRSLDDTCDHLLGALRHPDDHDDVALLMARVRSDPGDAPGPLPP